MQVSFHKYGDNFFPGTGASGDCGYSKGAGYSVNVPLKEGMDDESYKFIYEPVMKKVLEVCAAAMLPLVVRVLVLTLGNYSRFSRFLQRISAGSTVVDSSCAAGLSARGDRGVCWSRQPVWRSARLLQPVFARAFELLRVPGSPECSASGARRWRVHHAECVPLLDI